jgi:CubicO group peptidase (beta-lactamase class C family)
MKFNKNIAALCCLLLAMLQGSAQIKTVDGRKITEAEMDGFVKQQMDSLGMPGISIAVIVKGKIVYHRAEGVANIDTKVQVDDQSIFEAASMSKPLFAYFVMKQVDAGLLNLDTPLYKYMPYPDIEKDERYKLITARIVLTHQTGFPNWRYFDMADSSLHIKYGDLYLKFTPGAKFYYSGEGFLYLAKVIAFLRHRTLQTLDSLFEQDVALPLGMEYAWYTGNAFISKHKVSGHQDGKVHFYNGTTWPISFPNWDSSYFNPAASLHTEAVSYAHFLLGMMNGKGLSKTVGEEMLKPQIELPKDNTNVTDEGDHAWGLGIAIGETPYGRRYEHGGNNGNFQSGFAFFKQQKFGYVFLTNCDKGSIFNANLRKFLTGQ